MNSTGLRIFLPSQATRTLIQHCGQSKWKTQPSPFDVATAYHSPKLATPLRGFRSDRPAALVMLRFPRLCIVAVAPENFKAFIFSRDKTRLHKFIFPFGRGLVASIQIEVTKDHPHLIFGEKDMTRRNPKSLSKSALVPCVPRKMESLS